MTETITLSAADVCCLIAAPCSFIRGFRRVTP